MLPKDTPVIILCGGEGSRIADVSRDAVPKPLIRIGDKPILWHIMKIYEAHGFSNFILALGHLGWEIKDYFLNERLMDCDFRLDIDGERHSTEVLGQTPSAKRSILFVQTGEKTQTGERIARCRKYVTTDYFMATYGDGVGDVDVSALGRFAVEQGKIGTVTSVVPAGRFGNIEVSDGTVTAFNEKPDAGGGSINGGFFVFKREFFDVLDRYGDVMLEREPMDDLVGRGELAAYRHPGFWEPMDTMREYRQLNQMWESGEAEVEALVSTNGVFDSLAGRRVLITGHTGFKGSWLSLWLARLGAQVVGFSDAIPTSPSHFEALDLDLDDRRGDICDCAAIDAVIAETRPELVFHFAAQALVRKAYADPLATYRSNVVGTLAVLEAARRNGVGSIVVATTDKVYRNDESGRRYAEADELGGSDPYSASKSCVELMTHSYRQSIVRNGAMLIATVRAGNVIGGGDWAEDRLIPDLMRAAFSGDAVLIRNPASTRPWQHVLDVLAGYLVIGARLVARDSAAADAWNIGPLSDAGIRVAEIVEAVRAQLPELKVEIGADDSGRHESGLLQLDSTKAMTQLGWRPRWEGEMLDRTVSWYREFHQNARTISSEQLAAYEAALA